MARAAPTDATDTITNAYSILTNIQGFDSFQLGPHSSTDEITRAFQTQSLCALGFRSGTGKVVPGV